MRYGFKTFENLSSVPISQFFFGLFERILVRLLTDFGFERRRSFEKMFFFFFSVPRTRGFLWKRWFEEDEQKAREAALLQWVVKP
jgi:hypothetical protein